METFPLYQKASVQSIWADVTVKFKQLFTKVTGYDLMFAASRTDIKPFGLVNSRKPKNNTDPAAEVSWPAFFVLPQRIA